LSVPFNPNAKVAESLNLISFDKKGAYHAPIIGFQADIESYRALRKAYQETGDDEALIKAQAMLKEQQNITLGDRERLNTLCAIAKLGIFLDRLHR
jgi:hypothetical protein